MAAKSLANSSSRFGALRDQVEQALASDPVGMVSRMLSANIRGVNRPNGTMSIWGMKCPWCGKEGVDDGKDTTNLFLSSNRKKLHCKSCSGNDSVLFLALKSAGLSMQGDLDACVDKLSAVTGISVPEPRAYSDDIDVGSAPVPGSSFPTGQGQPYVRTEMPVDKKEWIENSTRDFLAKGATKNLSPAERAACIYIMRRGISEQTIKKSGLFVYTHNSKIMVVMPSLDQDGVLVGYQYFDYSDTIETGRCVYHTCKTEFGSSRWPFGVDTCTTKDSGPIIMVCGFFDYLSALEIGFTRVLSPFGINNLQNAKHIEDVVRGQSVTVLFDRKLVEVDQAWVTAKALVDVGARVNLACWKTGKIGFDLNDFLMDSRARGVTDQRAELSAMIASGDIVLVPDGKFEPAAAGAKRCAELEKFLKLAGIGLDGADLNVAQAAEQAQADAVLPEPVSAPRVGCQFEPDLNKAIGGLKPLESFHTIVMFTSSERRVVMCDTLNVKPCPLLSNCTCKAMSISDGKYAAAFCNTTSMKMAVDCINGTYDTYCLNTKGWASDGKDREKKRIIYKHGESSTLWSLVHGRSLFSSGSFVTMVMDVSSEVSGIYEVKGFMSQHCGTNSPVFVVSEIYPYRIDPIIDSMPIEKGPIAEAEFLNRVYSVMNSGVSTTDDAVLVAATCAWAFSPPVIPLIKDIGLKLANYRQPSLSIYMIGDPATGKTNTVKEITLATGNRCDPTDAKMATRPGLIISGSDGSPGQITRCVGKFIGLDEITDKDSVLDIVQLLVENRVLLSMSGRNIDEIVPVRVAILSNADAQRSKIHDFRTPMQAATNLFGEHMIRRIDMLVSTKYLGNDIDKHNRNYYFTLGSENSTRLSKSDLLDLGMRCLRQKPHLIEMDDDAKLIMKNENLVFMKFDEDTLRHVERLGNPMMYGDIRQKVFRIACGVASFSGSFSGEKLIVKLRHISSAIDLMIECMKTMGANQEAHYQTRTMNADSAHKILVSVCNDALGMMGEINELTIACGSAIINFIQECNAHEPGAAIKPGIAEAYSRVKDRAFGAISVDSKNDPRKRAWYLVGKMKRHGLIFSDKRSEYKITETFPRSVIILSQDDPDVYERVFKF